MNCGVISADLRIQAVHLPSNLSGTNQTEFEFWLITLLETRNHRACVFKAAFNVIYMLSRIGQTVRGRIGEKRPKEDH